MATAATSRRRKNGAAPPESKPIAFDQPSEGADASAPEMSEDRARSLPVEFIEYPQKNGSVAMGDPMFMDDTTPFWDWIETIPDQYWETDKCQIRVYRLEPKVKNEQDRSFISKWFGPIDEIKIKERHGGGKFQVLFKNKRLTKNRTTVFLVEGEPIFETGQMLVDEDRKNILGPAPVAGQPAHPAQPQNSELASVVRELGVVLQEMRRNPGADSNAMVTQAATACIEMVKNHAKSTTEGESKASDKLTTVLMDELKAARNPQAGAAPRDPVDELKRMLELMELLDRRRDEREEREPASAPEKQKSLAEQVQELRSVFGEEFSLGDLLHGGPAKPDWVSGLLEFAKPLLQNLPAMWNGFMTMRERQLELARRQLELQTQKPVQLSTRPAAPLPEFTVPLRPDGEPQPQVLTQGAPQPSATQPTPQEQQRMFDEKLSDIAKTIVGIYNGNGSGYQAALAVMNTYPAEINFLKPKLSVVDEVMNFARLHPVLSKIAGESDFQQFAEEFCAGVQDPGKAERDGEDESPNDQPAPKPVPPAS